MTLLFLNNFFHWLDKVDKQLFVKINSQWTTPILDNNMPWYRAASTWIPLYLFILLFIVFNYGKKSIPWLIAVAIMATISDQISSNLLKNIFERIRPCHDSFIQQQGGRLLVNYCPSSFSFPSSHAVNHFSAAMFIFLTLKTAFKKWSYLFLVWAASICYAQVYVGVHYPIDVAFGAFVGCLIGGSLGIIYNKRYKLPEV
ncbi:MAG: phosphatase PAP2 family protein [Chitinophagales bacterium]|nr:phosphatase PAP2 family protein [Chitinophagales bacterium]